MARKILREEEILAILKKSFSDCDKVFSEEESDNIEAEIVEESVKII